MRLKNYDFCSSATKLKGSLIICLILMLMLLEDLGVSSQDAPDAAPAADAGTEAAAGVDPAGEVATTAPEVAPVAPNDETTNAAQEPKLQNKPTQVFNQSLLLERFQSKPIFGINKCEKEMYCEGANGSRVHTLCKELKTPRCDRFREVTIFKFDGIKLINLEELIVNGHNGLRDRIAAKMHVGNMVELVWDDQLAHMTIAYYLQCAPDVDDPCTKFNIPDNLDPESTDYFEDDQFKWIAQNRFHMKAEFFPTNFLEVALRSWYFEKDTLVKPTLKTDLSLGITYGKLRGDNNFVHMAFPLSFRIGCSLAQIDKSFSLICNYYPFYRYKNKNNESEMTFVSGKPGTYCPTYFPLKHEYFPNLCTDQLNKAAKQIETLSFGAASLIVIIWLIWY